MNLVVAPAFSRCCLGEQAPQGQQGGDQQAPADVVGHRQRLEAGCGIGGQGGPGVDEEDGVKRGSVRSTALSHI